MDWLAQARIPAPDLNLAATLDSGQAFRWVQHDGAWEGVIGDRWVILRQEGATLLAQSPAPVTDWSWLTYYLGLDDNLDIILASFPPDPSLRAAIRLCRGLRILRQDPWECLVSFLLSSTKQIAQIRQVVGALCDHLGSPILGPAPQSPSRSFPSPQAIIQAGETTLRQLKAGFRAPYLVAAAQTVDRGQINLATLPTLPLSEARAHLMSLPGVGPKIADCVLLFSAGQHQAFPIDVWIQRALQQEHFRNRRVPLPQLRRFAARRFGPWAGYAQQYLFHYTRLHSESAP